MARLIQPKRYFSVVIILCFGVLAIGVWGVFYSRPSTLFAVGATVTSIVPEWPDIKDTCVITTRQIKLVQHQGEDVTFRDMLPTRVWDEVHYARMAKGKLYVISEKGLHVITRDFQSSIITPDWPLKGEFDISGDGNLIAGSDSNRARFQIGSRVSIYRLNPLELLVTLGDARHPVFNDRASHLLSITGEESNSLIIHEATHFKEGIHVPLNEERATTTSMYSEGMFAVGTNSGQILIVSIDGSVGKVIELEGTAVSALAYYRKSGHLLCADISGKLTVIVDGQVVKQYPGTKAGGSPTCAALSPDCKTAFVGLWNSRIRVVPVLEVTP